MKKIAIVGAGGFGQEVFCIWRDMLDSQKIEYQFLGFFDDNETVTENCFGKILGNLQ